MGGLDHRLYKKAVKCSVLGLYYRWKGRSESECVRECCALSP